MKKARKRETVRRSTKSGLADSYEFDYARSRPNRFAASFTKDVVTVVLDPDVARVFKSSRRVNSVLRASIAAMKKPPARRGK